MGGTLSSLQSDNVSAFAQALQELQFNEVTQLLVNRPQLAGAKLTRQGDCAFHLAAQAGQADMLRVMVMALTTASQSASKASSTRYLGRAIKPVMVPGAIHERNNALLHYWYISLLCTVTCSLGTLLLGVT